MKPFDVYPSHQTSASVSSSSSSNRHKVPNFENKTENEKKPIGIYSIVYVSHILMFFREEESIFTWSVSFVWCNVKKTSIASALYVIVAFALLVFGLDS